MVGVSNGKVPHVPHPIGVAFVSGSGKNDNTGLEEGDDGEDAADDGARRGDELVEGRVDGRDDDRDGREVVLEVDGGMRAVGGGEDRAGAASGMCGGED